MSDVFKLSGIDWKKLLKGLGIGLAGACLTYLSQWLTGADFGEMTPLIVAVLAFGVNFLRKLLTKTEA